jgi:cobalt-zinc-cadmium efflux system outer membrane protein
MRSHALSVVFFSAVLAGASETAAHAQATAAPAPTRVALADLVTEALRVNPEIKAAEQRVDAARQRPVQARSLPDPMVEAGYNSSGNPLPGAGLGKEPTANIGVMVSQQIPFPGKRALQSEMASHETHIEAAQLETARLSITSRVSQAYFGLAYAYAVRDVLDRNRDLLATLLKVSESRYSVGQAAQQDVIKAQTELSIVELRQQRIDQQRRTREGELNALLNRPAGSPVGRPEDLALPPFTATLDTLVDAAAKNAPMLQRDRVMIEHARVAVDLARKEYRPDLTVSGGYAYMGSMPPMYEVRVGINIPLQRQRRAAAVAEQVSSLGAAQNDYESSRLGLQSRIQDDFQMASTSARLAALYRDTVLPQARLALESSMSSYQTGAVDFLSVLTNFGTVLEYEMTYFEELSAFHAAASRLEEMIGTPIVH